jgi:hypothetical protein
VQTTTRIVDNSEIEQRKKYNKVPEKQWISVIHAWISMQYVLMWPVSNWLYLLVNGLVDLPGLSSALNRSSCFVRKPSSDPSRRRTAPWQVSQRSPNWEKNYYTTDSAQNNTNHRASSICNIIHLIFGSAVPVFETLLAVSLSLCHSAVH